MRSMRTVLVAGVAALALVVPTSGSASAASSRPCGAVSVGYTPQRVAPGQAMDMDMSVENCGSAFERLFLRVRWHGPCRFYHPTRHAYDLDEHQGVGLSVLMLAPDCPGRYTVRVRIEARGRTLDRDEAAFVVEGSAT